MRISKKVRKKLAARLQANLEAQEPAQVWLDGAVAQLVKRGVPSDVAQSIEETTRFLIGMFYAQGWDDLAGQVHYLANELEQAARRLRGMGL